MDAQIKVGDTVYVEMLGNLIELTVTEITFAGPHTNNPSEKCYKLSGKYTTSYIVESELISKSAATLGSMTSERKAASSKENGRKGGRPKMDRQVIEFRSSTFNCYKSDYMTDREYREVYRAACKHFGYKAQIEGGWRFFEFETDFRTWKNQK